MSGRVLHRYTKSNLFNLWCSLHKLLWESLQMYISNNTCSLCYKYCNELFGPTIENCTSCIKNYLLDDHSCKTECPDGKFKNLVNKTCDKCHSTCFTCRGPRATDCLKCNKSSFFLHWNNTCLTACPSGLTADTI